MTRIARAKAMAERAHEGQVDKGGHPYIEHPLRLSRAVSKGQAQVVALLHDVVEDGGVSLDEIVSQFGFKVAEAVDALTRRKGEAYGDFVERCAANELAREVKIADLKDNMDASRLGRELTEQDWRRLDRYAAALARLTGASQSSRIA